MTRSWQSNNPGTFFQIVIIGIFVGASTICQLVQFCICKSEYSIVMTVSKSKHFSQAPDYYEVVRKPMDLRTIREKLTGMKYTTDEEFIADVMLVFQNCQQYNMDNTPEYNCGVSLSAAFLEKVHELGLTCPGLPACTAHRQSKRRR